MPPLSPIKKRADFLKANGGSRASKPSFVVLGIPRDGIGKAAPPADAVRYGLTVTKKLGKAVIRNRIRRRLRAVALSRLPALGRPGWDYVLIGREAALHRDFAAMQGDLESALEMLHKAPRAKVGR